MDQLYVTFPLWKIIFFLVVSSGILSISRASLFNPRSHAFFRFFAWELILLLFLINISFWFDHPLSWNQVISWCLLLLCILPVVWGMILLIKFGKPVENRSGDASLFGFEKTSHLVTNGIYRYIRHPLYCSLLLLSWGIFMKHPSWIGAILAILASVFLFLTSWTEEKELVLFFGSAYQDYMKTSKRFIPFIF